MNKENIIDYVVHTPHNPNKKVLDDMLETLIEENGAGECDWNTLKNKPFEETIEVAEIYPLQNIEASEGDEEFDYKGYASDTYLEIKTGNQYTVYINGIEYVCEATESVLKNEDSDTVIMLGNSAVAHGDEFFTRFYPEELKDTGEPFFIYTRKSKNTACDWKYALGETITIEIVEEQENIKQLDGKFVEGTNFIVTITQRFEEEGGEEPLYAKDKSFEEIMMAYKSGRNVLALFKAYEEEGEGYFSHYIIPITHCSDTSIVFTGHEYWDNGMSIEISSYDPPLDVLVSEHSLSSTEEIIMSNVDYLIDQKLSSIGVAEGGEF